MNNSAQKVIKRVLQELGAPAYRTQLVKLVYFVDYIYHRHVGSTLTGLSYTWDHYGPNASNGEIVREADDLAQKGDLRKSSVLNPFGDISYQYDPAPGSQRIHLGSMAEAIIHDVVQKYRHLTVTRIAAASKKTKPFGNATQGDPLDFGEAAIQIAETESVEGEELQVAGTWGKSVQDLRLKYALS
jgi:hypothetical protein